MAVSWYYVQGNDRVGPVEESELQRLIGDALSETSYVWRKGFDNWIKLGEVQELAHLLSAPVPKFVPPEMHPTQKERPVEEFTFSAENLIGSEEEIEQVTVEVEAENSFDWENLSRSRRCVSIKIGMDRGGPETEYGPYTLDELKRAYDERRINGRTLIFAPGLDSWTYLADIPIFEKIFHSLPPVIEDSERRHTIRRPFVAKLFFHDNSDLFEGVCRDISIGGMQILVSDFPGNVGEKVILNVHPKNDEYRFVAQGEIVRLLPGRQGFSLRFTELKEEAMNSINEYVSSNL